MTRPNTCSGCAHWRDLYSNAKIKACHYCVDTGKLRNCAVDACKAYTKGRIRRSKRQIRIRKVTDDDYIITASMFSDIGLYSTNRGMRE